MSETQKCPFCKPAKKCNSKSCPYTNILKNNVVDLSGQIFGRLEALSYERNEKYSRNMWKCKCSCGNTTYVHTKNLLKGSTKSCGCLRKDKMEEFNRRRPSQTAINAFYKKYLKKAIKRGLEFKLTIEEFEEIASKNCFYCGQEPIEKIKTKNSIFTGNGIDRVNNSKGYFLENCVPCCTFCNVAKMDNSYKDFLYKISKIYNNHCITKESK